MAVTGSAERAPEETKGVMLVETTRGSTGQNAAEAGARRDGLFEAFKDGLQVVQDGGWPAWSPLVQTHERGSSFCAEVGCDYSFANSRYQVLVNFELNTLRLGPTDLVFDALHVAPVSNTSLVVGS